MPLHKILKQERAQALSNPVVIGLAAILVTAGIVLAWATMIALVSSGNYLLSLLASVPLGAGLGHYALATVRYCRPQWFKPEEPTEQAEQPKADTPLLPVPLISSVAARPSWIGWQRSCSSAGALPPCN